MRLAPQTILCSPDTFSLASLSPYVLLGNKSKDDLPLLSLDGVFWNLALLVKIEEDLNTPQIDQTFRVRVAQLLIRFGSGFGKKKRAYQLLASLWLSSS